MWDNNQWEKFDKALSDNEGNTDECLFKKSSSSSSSSTHYGLWLLVTTQLLPLSVWALSWNLPLFTLPHFLPAPMTGLLAQGDCIGLDWTGQDLATILVPPEHTSPSEVTRGRRDLVPVPHYDSFPTINSFLGI